MPALKQYTQFKGRAPVSSSIKNSLEYQGIIAAHNGQPLSEALLAGIAGGICFGYFVFQYKAQHPQVNILTRNSFHNYGWDAITERLGIKVNITTSTSPRKAESKLLEVLEAGLVPIVFADVFTLGYEHSEFGDGMWAMQPIIVVKYDISQNRATIVDRSINTHSIPADLLNRARGRVQRDRYRMAILSVPALETELGDVFSIKYRSVGVHATDSAVGNPNNKPVISINTLRTAVKEGIQEAFSLFTQKPPKGSANNFGFKAFKAIMHDLRSSTGKSAWKNRFPKTSGIYSALSTAYKYSQLFWKDPNEAGDRILYSSFLDEAAVILEKPSLSGVANLFRKSAIYWKTLANRLLPESFPELSQLRGLIDKRNQLFINLGSHASEELQIIDQKIDTCISNPEPLSTMETTSIFGDIADCFNDILRVEQEAILELEKNIDWLQ